MRIDDWRRFAAPAAFLLAVTLAVALIRSGIEAGGSGGGPTVSIPTIPHRQVVVPGTHTTTAHTATHASPRYWTVKAGDTFGVISTGSGVPVATIQRLNPAASSTTLHIGEKIRLR